MTTTKDQAEAPAGRGVLTERIQKLWHKITGGAYGDITTGELRLFPYVWTRAMENFNIKREHLRGDDRAILKTWQERGWIGESPMTDLRVSAQWWRIAAAMTYLAYPVGMDNDLLVEGTTPEEVLWVS